MSPAGAVRRASTSEPHLGGHDKSSSEEYFSSKSRSVPNLKIGSKFENLEEVSSHDDLDTIPSRVNYMAESVSDEKKMICCGRFDPDAVCCYTTTRTKRVIIMIALLAFSLLLLIFGFAIPPIPYKKRHVYPLTTAPATTTGFIKVLLLGNIVKSIQHMIIDILCFITVIIEFQFI